MIRKTLITLAAGLTAVSASAGFRWGPTVGVDVNTLSWKQPLLATSQLASPMVGLMGEVMIPGIGFGVDFGLRYARQGAKVNFGEHKIWSASGLGDEKVFIHTLEIPLDLRFKWTRMDGLEQYIAPFAYGGPVFTFNLADNGVGAVQTPAGYLAVHCGLGVELLRRFQISAGYSWGVSYILKTVKLDNLSAQSRSWNVALTYLF